jgi:hypothetical protein
MPMQQLWKCERGTQTDKKDAPGIRSFRVVHVSPFVGLRE